MSEAGEVLAVRGLTKSFGKKVAVDHIDLKVERGEIVAFLGPNGAGKTTVMNMITGLLEPDSGEIVLFDVAGGQHAPELRARMAFLQEKPRVYPEMSGRSYLRLFADIYAVPDPSRRVEELLDLVGLPQAANRALGTYSRGMQQRACLARTMLHSPEFLVLDEPTLGLDPNGVREIREIFLRMNAAGVALLFSSHQLAEMERLCDRVILMDGGKVVAVGSKDELLERVGGGDELDAELAEVNDALLARLAAEAELTDIRRVGESTLRMRLSAPPGDLRAARGIASRMLTKAGGVVLSVARRPVTLEDLFVSLTGRSIH